MGGCASAPKDLYDEAAPAPELPKEETVENHEEVKAEQEATEVEENNDKSLGTLLDQPEEKKEIYSEEKKEEVPSEPKKEEAEVAAAEPKEEEEAKAETEAKKADQ